MKFPRVTTYLNRIALVSVIAAMLTAISSCGPSRVTTATYTGKNISQSEFKIPTGLTEDTRAILSEAKKWLGVPYRYGGNDKSGVDCSGLIVGVFDNALNMKLPRNSAKQNEFCIDIDRKGLQPGDLVFFDTTRNHNGHVSHVGLYIGDGRMIHSSSSKGVIVSAIDDNYYAERFIAGGRIPGSRQKNEIAGNNANPGRKAAKNRGTSAKPYTLVKVDKRDISHKQAPATKASEPTAADARNQVLNSIIETKIDSILTTAQ